MAHARWCWGFMVLLGMVIWCAAVGDRTLEGLRDDAKLRRGWCAWQESNLRPSD